MSHSPSRRPWGRVIFGAGVGWVAKEFDGMKADFKTTGSVTNEHRTAQSPHSVQSSKLRIVEPPDYPRAGGGYSSRSNGLPLRVMVSWNSSGLLTVWRT